MNTDASNIEDKNIHQIKSKNVDQNVVNGPSIPFVIGLM